MFGGRNKQGRTDNKFSGIVSLLYYLYFTGRQLQQEQWSDGRLKTPFSSKELGGFCTCMDSLRHLIIRFEKCAFSILSIPWGWLALPRFHIWSCNLSPWAQSHLLKQEPLLFPWKSPEGFVLSLRFTSQLGQWQYQHRWGLCCFVCLFDLKSPLYFDNNNQITNIHHLYKCQLLRCLPSDAGIICPMAIRTPRMTYLKSVPGIEPCPKRELSPVQMAWLALLTWHLTSPLPHRVLYLQSLNEWLDFAVTPCSNGYFGEWPCRRQLPSAFSWLETH